MFYLVSFCVVITAETAWQHLVNGLLYHCTDPVFAGFIFPGSWVHNPVEVRRVGWMPGSGADTIKLGWTPGDLWVLWGVFVVVSQSITLSIVIAWMRFERGVSEGTAKGWLPTKRHAMKRSR